MKDELKELSGIKKRLTFSVNENVAAIFGYHNRAMHISMYFNAIVKKICFKLAIAD